MSQSVKVCLILIFVIICFMVCNAANMPLKCNVDISKNSIDCSGRELTTTIVLLNSVDAMKIKNINYSNNKIIQVKGLDNFRNVEAINFNLNSLTNVTSLLFSPLKYLRDLDLSFNNIEVLDPYIFIKNKRLKKLSLRGNFFTPSDEKPIVCSASLKVLDIGTNAIPRLTEENLLCLPSLTELDLSSNSLLTLTPEIFSPLKNLVSINLRFNRFYCDCKLPELIKWAKSMKTDMSSSDPVFCVLPNNRGMTEFEKIEKDLNCTSEQKSIIPASLKTQNEKTSSEFYDYMLISYDTDVLSSDRRVSSRFMGIVSSKLYTIEALLSLVLFLLVIITAMLFCRHYRTMGDVSDTISEYSIHDPFLSEKMSTQLIQKSPGDHMYVHVK